ncbi:uncharacterized protein LOC120702516 isoform X27 [Panicum virgatum]|uniref:uncharacterized protein LOC120702516 isoform X27 n=1 Tax=Panicum virgatum TaxID=38727 RepID=UPI0019D631D0|nr:uncharacterized protein LOC120702516 isoform X27 [Panicum virgatum]
MNNSRTIERRAHHVHLTGWSHVLENLRVVCPLHFVCSSSLSRVSLSSPSALAAIAEIAPITHYRCAPLDPSVESAGFEVKIRPSWNPEGESVGCIWGGFESGGADRGNCEDQGQRISARPVLFVGGRNTGGTAFSEFFCSQINDTMGIHVRKVESSSPPRSV